MSLIKDYVNYLEEMTNLVVLPLCHSQLTLLAQNGLVYLKKRIKDESHKRLCKLSGGNDQPCCAPSVSLSTDSACTVWAGVPKEEDKR